MLQETPSDRTVVLVVEDEPLLRSLVTDFLEEEGFAVLTAETGDQGLAVLRTSQHVSVLFTDVDMPGSLDGFALARITRQSLPHVITVIVSGRAMPTRGDLPEGTVFIPKPYRPDAIAQTIWRLINPGT